MFSYFGDMMITMCFASSCEPPAVVLYLPVQTPRSHGRALQPPCSLVPGQDGRVEGILRASREFSISRSGSFFDRDIFMGLSLPFLPALWLYATGFCSASALFFIEYPWGLRFCVYVSGSGDS